jgi:hypothetical protein
VGIEASRFVKALARPQRQARRTGLATGFALGLDRSRRSGAHLRCLSPLLAATQLMPAAASAGPIDPEGIGEQRSRHRHLGQLKTT